MSWEDLDDFNRPRARGINGPYITIGNNRSFTLSIGFMKEAKTQILNHTHAILGFSKKNNAIVFEFISNENFAGAIKISRREKNGLIIQNNNDAYNAVLASRSFFNYFNIDIKKYAGRYRATLEEISDRGGLWVIYLDNPYKESYNDNTN